MATSTLAPPGIGAGGKNVGVPNTTLYIRNLPDKLRKEDLKRNLYMLFATYGVVLDVVALKTPKMRGQAHVVFRNVDMSTQAMRALQDYTFFGKDMQIAYAKTKSDTLAKLDGTYKMPEPEKPAAPPAAPAGTHGAGQTNANESIFGAAPTKAVPVNEQERAKGVKRGREEEEEEEESEDEGAAMDVSDSDDD